MSRLAAFAVFALAVFALSAVLACGCGAGANPNGAALRDLELGTRALDRAIGVQTAFVVSGNVDTGATPQIIAAAIANRVMSEAAGCVSAAATDATVHADFGAGCTLATASMHAGGTVDVIVAPDMTTGGVTITLVFAATVDGAPLQGTLVVSTTSGNSFTYASDGLSLDGVTATAPLVTAGIAAGGATLDAAHATANGTALVLAGVHERFAACYPDEGAATFGALGVTFASDTPQTGDVTLSTGAMATLPKRSSCPK